MMAGSLSLSSSSSAGEKDEDGGVVVKAVVVIVRESAIQRIIPVLLLPCSLFVFVLYRVLLLLFSLF